MTSSHASGCLKQEPNVVLMLMMGWLNHGNFDRTGESTVLHIGVRGENLGVDYDDEMTNP